MQVLANRKWLLVLLGLLAAFVAVTVIVLSMSDNAVADATAPAYQVNDNGETYGSQLDMVHPEQTPPNLIAAMATNGQEGYIYNADLIAADPMPSGPEEAMLRQERRNIADAKIFVRSLSEQLGIDISVSDAVALEAYMAARGGLIDSAPGADDAAIGDLGADLTGILSLGETGIAPADEWERVVFQAIITIQETNTIDIPVYEQDGVTVIGVFKAGSYRNTADAQ